MKFYRAAKYLEYAIYSGHWHGHGIHSPFVFDLVSRVFRNKSGSDVVCSIEKIRKSLLRDSRIITVNDLGAGREKNNATTRKVSKIASHSAIPGKYGMLLSNLASEFGKQNIVELGTSLGISTMYIASACPGAEVYSIDACEECTGIAAENFSIAGLGNIRQLNGSFDSVLPSFLATGVKPDFVFIDGDHRKETLIKNFSLLADNSQPETVIAIDDIYDSPGMTEAWSEIRQHSKVSVSVDVFRMGIVFFREGISRNHYIIRY